MHWYLKLLIYPLLDALGPRVVVEVGVEVGAVTGPLLQWAQANGATVHAVDPDPTLNVDRLTAQYGEQLRFHRRKSLEVLDEIADVDLALIDGDHNWYTVIEELRALERRARGDGREPPVVLLHDVGWPYGRRDLYYDPQAIPEAHRQPHARAGVKPGRSELGPGLNDHLENAQLEGTPANGVLTAVEDYVAQSPTQWRTWSLPGLSGMAILASGPVLETSEPLRELLDSLERPAFLRAHCEAIEQARIEAELKRANIQRRLAETQLKQVMRSPDPRAQVALHRQVRQLTERVAELEEDKEERAALEEQVRVLDGELRRWTDAGAAGVGGEGVAPHTDERGNGKVALSGEGPAEGDSQTAGKKGSSSQAADDKASGSQAADNMANGNKTGDSDDGGTFPPAPEPDPAAEREAWRTLLDLYLPLLDEALPCESERDPLSAPAPLDVRGVLCAEGEEQEPDTPSVDVVICVHDALAQVRECLWSLLAKTERRLRLILVDDGSAELTARFLRAFVDRHPAVTLIRRTEPPHGYTLAANRGLEASGSDYIVLLNSDTVLSSGWLERILACGESHPEVGILGPLSNAATHQSVPSVRSGNEWATNPLPAWLTTDAMGAVIAGVSPHAAHPGPQIRSRQARDPAGVLFPFINGFCYAIKRGALERVGLLDSERFAEGYCEENDYSLRARAAGFELCVVDDAYVYHAKSASYGVEGRAELARRNYEGFLEKHGREEVQALVAAQEDDRALAPLRAAVAEATASPRSVVQLLGGAGGSPLSVVFLLPGLAHGGSGGSHSLYQEARALRALGVPARVMLPRWDMARAAAVYEDAQDIFEAFADEQDLAERTRDAHVISATHHKSVALLAAIRERRSDFLAAYYVQDYEPFFTAPYIAQEAVASYTALPDMLLFAKSHWLCNVVAERHGLSVAKVEPSIDRELFTAGVPTVSAQPTGVSGIESEVDGSGVGGSGASAKSSGPLRVVAMVRPRTARRQPLATVAVLEELLALHPGEVQVSTFGCYADELAELLGELACDPGAPSGVAEQG